MSLWIHIERAIRTGLRTGFATDTATLIEINDAIIATMQGLNRADIDTGRFRAMVAPKNSKISSAVGKCSLFNIFHPGAVYSEGYLVFRFTCDRTRMTSDTLSGINNETVIHGVVGSK
jgi:hypothetical protein